MYSSGTVYTFPIASNRDMQILRQARPCHGPRRNGRSERVGTSPSVILFSL